MKQRDIGQNEYDELKQIELAIQSAEHMVGQATRSMDEEQLEAATNALQDARNQLKKATAFEAGFDQHFFEMSEELLAKADHQLKEAKDKE